MTTRKPNKNAGKYKSFKALFFVVVVDGERKHDVLKDLLTGAKNGYTEAVPLDAGEDEEFQIRSIVPLGKDKAFKGVFGRCRFGETPVQGTTTGEEADVVLRPGHGLVEKNHFMFFADRNLILYQRNPSGSHPTRLQRYLNVATGQNLVLESLLTTDAYKRLIEGGSARWVDISYQMPADPEAYSNVWSKDLIRLLGKLNTKSARIRISVGHSSQSLVDQVKDALITLARGGFARVARAKLEDVEEPIDLITERVIETINVPLDEHGRPQTEDLYAALTAARDKRQQDIKTFFEPVLNSVCEA
jgi:hypothetical protein